MNFQGVYKFKTEAIPVKIKLFFRYNYKIEFPYDQVFTVMGDSEGETEIFRNTIDGNGYYIRITAFFRSVTSREWVFGFIGDSSPSPEATNIERLELAKKNTLFAVINSKRQIIKRYPEPSENDIRAAWLLYDSDYELWESRFLVSESSSFFPTTLDLTDFTYIGGGIFGSVSYSFGRADEYNDFKSSFYTTEENNYLINDKRLKVIPSPPFNSQSYLHPVFNVIKNWNIPGAEYIPWIFSEDRKEMIYVKIEYEFINSIKPLYKEVYYTKFDDEGNIIEETLIVNLSDYESLPLDDPNRLQNEERVPEIPFWRVSSTSNGSNINFRPQYNTGEAQVYSRFKKGKVEWFDRIRFYGDGFTIEDLLSRDYIEIDVAQWDGARFTYQGVKRYQKTPTRQDLIDLYKNSNQGGSSIFSFDLVGVAFE